MMKYLHLILMISLCVSQICLAAAKQPIIITSGSMVCIEEADTTTYIKKTGPSTHIASFTPSTNSYTYHIRHGDKDLVMSNPIYCQNAFENLERSFAKQK